MKKITMLSVKKCGKPNSCYRKELVKQKLINLEDISKKAHEWHDKHVMIFKDGQWYNTKDENLKDLGPDDVAVNNWNRPEERYTTLERLGLHTNAHLQAVIDRLHNFDL